MNVLLQKHGAKHIYKVPEGLRELCADIAREVLRSQPRNIYCFVADYVEALLIARENAKVAVKVVNTILLGSQAIMDILHRSGLSLEQIARVTPRIQTAFRAYLDAVDMRAAQVYDDTTCDERSEVSLQSILRATGVPLEQAERHATIIQAAFRGHYERMKLNETHDMIQGQQAPIRTLEILRKTDASQAEASKAAILIQATYRGYYTRKNLKMKMSKITQMYFGTLEQYLKSYSWPPAMQLQEEEQEKKTEIDIEPRETVQAVAGSDTMYEEPELTAMKAHEAASIIQKAYRQYRQKKNDRNALVESTRSAVTEAVLNNLHQKVFDEVVARADIPMEFDNREDLTEANEESQSAFTDRLMRALLAEEEYDEEKLIHVEELNESFEKPVNNSIGVMEDWQESQRIEVEPERDEETDTERRDEPINMETADKRNERREKNRDNEHKEFTKRKTASGDTADFNAHAYV